MIRTNRNGNNGKYRNAKQGRFFPSHPEKFTGNYVPIFKSSLEYRFMLYADRNPNVIAWGYETFPIKYLDTTTGKIRNYYLDFVLLMKTPLGTRKVWVEVKDSRETHKPRSLKNIRDNLIWEKNQCKWKAAFSLARQRGCDFKILTERELV